MAPPVALGPQGILQSKEGSGALAGGGANLPQMRGCHPSLSSPPPSLHPRPCPSRWATQAPGAGGALGAGGPCSQCLGTSPHASQGLPCQPWGTFWGSPAPCSWAVTLLSEASPRPPLPSLETGEPGLGWGGWVRSVPGTLSGGGCGSGSDLSLGFPPFSWLLSTLGPLAPSLVPRHPPSFSSPPLPTSLVLWKHPHPSLYTVAGPVTQPESGVPVSARPGEPMCLPAGFGLALPEGGVGGQPGGSRGIRSGQCQQAQLQVARFPSL